MSVQTLDQRLAALRDLRRRVDAEIARVETAIADERTEAQRQRRSRHDRPACGTEAAYQWHRYREDRVTCGACRAAHSRHVTDWRAARRGGVRTAGEVA